MQVSLIFFLIVFIGVPVLITNDAIPDHIRFSGMALTVFCIYGFVVGFKNRKIEKKQKEKG